jgi:AraC family transcriptional regulator of adaptative response/methylated-DNA-[protein]-cysteine methyltransferase
LTLAHARELLRRGESVLDAALGAGLSGPGRLHELCVTLEAASPGEMKSGGQGWTLLTGFADTPFGTCLVAQSPRGICHFSFVEPGGQRSALAVLQGSWPRAPLRRDDRAAQGLVGLIFRSFMIDASSGPPPLRAYVRGTAFQVRVWRALLGIPPGTLVSYGRLAAAVGHPAAARAVGAAVGQNPVAYLIPCHRVIRETGALGGYGGGLVRKRAILAWETAVRAA